MEENRKLFFIQNMEALQSESVTYNDAEYEVLTDAHIIGDFDYGAYRLRIWEFSDKQPGVNRKLNLFVRMKQLEQSELLPQPDKKALYHGGGVIDEIVSLSSLFLRRRLQLGAITRMNGSPQYYEKNKAWLDRDLIKNTSNLGEVNKWLDKVKKLDVIHHQRFILATKLYHRALLIIEEQPDIAYLNLISSIEVLCQDTPLNVTLGDLDKKMNKLVSKIEDIELRKEIINAIIKREKFISRRFVQFILCHIKEDFWSDPTRPEIGKIKAPDFPSLLKKIYNQRSDTLHNGTPFPPYIFEAPYEGSEIHFSLGMQQGHKKWGANDFIPYPHFFEKLVNHVLKEFLNTNS